jgi:hypothetical protein
MSSSFGGGCGFFGKEANVLHPIKPAKCLKELEWVVQFQRGVLIFASTTRVLLPLTPEIVKRKFRRTGSWLCTHLWFQSGERKGQAKPLCEDLEALIRHVRTNPDCAKKIIAAFDNDVHFVRHMEEPAFRFGFQTELSEDTRKVVRPVMEAFYTELLDSGFGSEIHGNAERLSRNGFVAKFWGANEHLNVCPACDGQRTDSTDKKIYSDADHFFPKSDYPFLSVHPWNLVPICTDCNRYFKLDRDPVSNHDQSPLSSTFHPYCKPALHSVSLSFGRTDTGDYELWLHENDGTVSSRVQNMNRVFKLEERWRTSRIKAGIEKIVEELYGAKATIERFGETLDEVNMETELKSMLDRKTEKIGRQPNYILLSNYLEYALNTPAEFQELVRVFD